MLTEPFADQVQRAMAYQTSDRPLPAISLPHPMQNISPEELHQRATVLADAAQKLLQGEMP